MTGECQKTTAPNVAEHIFTPLEIYCINFYDQLIEMNM